ncbi:MAG: hypothetical protein ABSF29_15665, partial [Tepidisphaeraceae bacterium]
MIVLLVAALAVRLAWDLRAGNDSGKLPDEREYLELGKNLHAGEGLWFIDVRFRGPVFAYRTPGYPFLISLCAG